MNELDDLSPMPFGKAHLGKPMQDVPVSYLHWMWHEFKDDCPRNAQGVINYIKKNLQALKMEKKDLIWS